MPVPTHATLRPPRRTNSAIAPSRKRWPTLLSGAGARGMQSGRDGIQPRHPHRRRGRGLERAPHDMQHGAGIGGHSAPDQADRGEHRARLRQGVVCGVRQGGVGPGRAGSDAERMHAEALQMGKESTEAAGTVFISSEFILDFLMSYLFVVENRKNKNSDARIAPCCS